MPQGSEVIDQVRGVAVCRGEPFDDLVLSGLVGRAGERFAARLALAAETSTAPQSGHSWERSERVGPRRTWPQLACSQGASGHEVPSCQMRTWRGVTGLPSVNVQPHTS
jgi:hypothetical protein